MFRRGKKEKNSEVEISGDISEEEVEVASKEGKVSIPKKIVEILSGDEEVIKVVKVKRTKDLVHPKNLIITTKRAVIYKPGFIGKNYEDYPFDAIDSIDFKKGLLSSGIVIRAGIAVGEIDGLPKDDAMEAFRIIRHYWQNYKKESEKPVIVQSQQIDVAEQLKKLAELKEMGIITEEEFEEKRRKLLDML